MNYICPVCNEDFQSKYIEKTCTHRLGKYTAYVYNDGLISIWYTGKFVVRLERPKRLDETYIDMILLLK